MTTSKQLYRYARQHGLKAHAALHAAREYIAGPLAKYQADLAAWNAQPDKRRYAPGGAANRPQYPTFYKSRDTSAHGPRATECGGYANIPTCVLAGLRSLGFVDELQPRLVDHKGWFADAYQDEIYRAEVWQLPARNGTLQYIAGYSEKDAGYSVLDCTRGQITIFDSLRDAIRAGDHCAEHFAEEAREYSERWQEASAANDERDNARTECKAERAEYIALMRAGETDMADDRVYPRWLASLRAIIAASEKIAELDMQGEF
jgi:hypothetical protein